MAGKSHNFLEDGFDLPKLEEKVLAFWDEHGIFEKSLAKNRPKSPKSVAARKKTFVFYEGPPYANGKPGIHHVLARVVKDVMLRYKTMRGYYVPRRAGWDTHGLPVEMAAEKALGLKTKRDIEALGVKKFNEAAMEQVWIHEDEWVRLTRRIGYWLDLKNAYVTYAPEYIETVWWTLAEIAKRGFLYQGHRIVQWCTRCGTSLSSHELAQGYQEVTDNSVYVKVWVPGLHAFILTWTTTPWTLPGNIALAINSKLRYAIFDVHPIGGPGVEHLIVAEERWPAIREILRASGKYYDVDIYSHQPILAQQLLSQNYDPLFKVPALEGGNSYKIYDADFVTATDGTGIVHTAVMYGEDDYQLGKKIGLPEHHTVDEEGKFTKDVPGLAGAYVKAKETEEKIFAHLTARNALVRVEPYAHEYPHCWRCGTPILYYARTSWFIKMSALRKELLARNEKINWMPSHVREGRFGEWLREVKDWNLSRERYWGAPLPIWQCRECGRTETVGSLDELSRLAGGARNRYFVMRHGEAEGNVRGIADSGQQAFHLTPRGRKQVAASITKLKKALSKRGEKIDLVFASDIMRTRETERIDEEILEGERAHVDRRLEEIHLGPALTGKNVRDYYVAYPAYEDRFEKRPEGGESLRDVRARVWNFLRECEKKYEGKNILIVTHEYPAWMLFHAAEGWSEKRAIAEQEKQGGEYLAFAEIRELPLRAAPRNDTGMVDLHRPFVDELEVRCLKCRAAMRRTPEVADVWYDSGAMPLAQDHYPFEHEHDLAYPADYIAEGMDQTRGWFYTMLAIATALGRPAPYKNVITFGLINDKFGKKMSKSVGNIVEPFAVIDQYGVDAVRWYFYSGTPFGEPKNFDALEIAKALRQMHLIVYNSFVFYKTYAVGGAFSAAAGSGTSVKASSAPRSANVLDRWILARLAELTDSVTRKLDRYEIREAAIEIGAFVDDLSRWYIRRSRRRLQRPLSAKDFRAASATLGALLMALTKILAPFTPFFAEALYGGLGGKQMSVHLEDWPKASGKPQHGAAEKRLIAQMALARSAAAAGLAKRAEVGIKVRQPLASMAIGVKLAEEIRNILADEVNVKKIVFDAKLGDGVALDTAITPALREEGTLREVARMVQELRQEAGLAPKDRIAVMLELPPAAREAVMKHEADLRNDVGAKLVEYRRSAKFSAESEAKIEGEAAWVGIRKI